ncbi:hypothetical protein pb186bvf_016427 [Paramecium bursaria]
MIGFVLIINTRYRRKPEESQKKARRKPEESQKKARRKPEESQKKARRKLKEIFKQFLYINIQFQQQVYYIFKNSNQSHTEKLMEQGTQDLYQYSISSRYLISAILTMRHSLLTVINIIGVKHKMRLQKQVFEFATYFVYVYPTYQQNKQVTKIGNLCPDAADDNQFSNYQ